VQVQSARRREGVPTYRCGPLFVTGGRFDGSVCFSFCASLVRVRAQRTCRANSIGLGGTVA
jgi:hypothetical protein